MISSGITGHPTLITLSKTLFKYLNISLWVLNVLGDSKASRLVITSPFNERTEATEKMNQSKDFKHLDTNIFSNNSYFVDQHTFYFWSKQNIVNKVHVEELQFLWPIFIQLIFNASFQIFFSLWLIQKLNQWNAWFWICFKFNAFDNWVIIRITLCCIYGLDICHVIRQCSVDILQAYFKWLLTITVHNVPIVRLVKFKTLKCITFLKRLTAKFDLIFFSGRVGWLVYMNECDF